MPIQKKDMEKFLKTKLKCEDEDNGHRIFWYLYKGKRVVRTHTSHGPDESLGPRLLGRMARQMELRLKELKQCVECDITKNDYDKILEERVPDRLG